MKRWAILFGLMIIVIVVLADTRHLGVIGAVYGFPYGDKAGHFLLFGLLNLLTNLAVFERWPKHKRFPLAVRTSLVLAVLIGLEELSQRWFRTRTSSVWDLTASYLGLIVSAGVALVIDKRKIVGGAG